MNYIVSIFNFGLYREGKIAKEVNFKLNSTHLLGDFKMLQSKRDLTWTPQAEFRVTGNWFNTSRFMPQKLKDIQGENNGVLMATIKPL